MDTDAILELLKTRSIQSADDESSPLVEFDLPGLWAGLISAAKPDPRISRYAIAPLLFHLHEESHDLYRATDVPAVSSEIAVFSDRTLPLPDRFASAASLIQWIPAFSVDYFRSVLTASVSYIEDYISGEQKYPKDFLDLYTEEVLSPLGEHLVEATNAFFLAAPSSESFVGSLVLLATLSDTVGEADDSGLGVVRAVRTALGSTDPAVQAAAAYAFSELVSVYGVLEQEVRPPTEEVWDQFVKLLTGEDTLASRYGARAYRQFIRAGILRGTEFLQRFIATFGQFQAKNKVYFTKVLQTYVFPDEDGEDEEEEEEENQVDLAVLQPIYDWVEMTLSSQDANERGLALDTLSDLTGKSKEAGEGLIHRGVEVAIALVNSDQFPVFEFVANFLVIVAEHFAPAEGAAVAALLPPLISSLDNEATGRLKIRLYTAAAIATIISQGVGKDALPGLITYVQRTLPGLDDDHLWIGAAIVLPLKELIPENTANALFPVFANRAIQTTSDDHIAGWSKILTQLVKHASIAPEVVAGFTDAILTGKLQIFYGRSPGKCLSVPTTIFSFLSRVVKRSPLVGRPIVEAIMEWFEDGVFQPIPVLKPIKSALAVGVFDEALARRLAPIIHGVLRKCDSGDGEEIQAATQVIAALFAAFPRTLDPIEELLETYTELVHAAAAAAEAGDEEDGEDPEANEADLIEAMPTVCQLIVDIYTSSSEVPVKDGLLKDVVSLLPFPPIVPEQTGILEGLVELVNEGPRFKCIAAPFAQVLVSLLMRKGKELDEYAFSSELIADLKKTMKKIVKSDKKLETAILQQFRSSKAKLNHFRALIR
jgi:hypothetical protein